MDGMGGGCGRGREIDLWNDAPWDRDFDKETWRYVERREEEEKGGEL